MNELKAPLRSDGQRLLRASGYGVTEISRALKVTKGAVSLWFSGQRVPTSDVRRDLEKLLGIAVNAWDAKPAAEAPSAAPVRKNLRTKKPVRPRLPLGEIAANPPAELVTATAPADAREVPPLAAIVPGDPLGGVRALIARCQTGIALQGLSAAEAKSWQDQLLAALKMEQILLHQEEIREDTIARSPAWLRLRERIVAALRAHPAALSAVVAVLEG